MRDLRRFLREARILSRYSLGVIQKANRRLCYKLFPLSYRAGVRAAASPSRVTEISNSKMNGSIPLGSNLGSGLRQNYRHSLHLQRISGSRVSQIQCFMSEFEKDLCNSGIPLHLKSV